MEFIVSIVRHVEGRIPIFNEKEAERGKKKKGL